MATLQTIISYARTQAQTDSNGLTDTIALQFANEALLDFRRRLISKGVDAAQIQEVTRDATAGEGRYLYPTDPQLWFLKAIELNYSSTNEQDYVRATQVDVSNLPGNVSVGWFRKNANRQEPAFDDRGDWYEIFPTPMGTDNLSTMIREFYFLIPSVYTATSNTIAYPESIDYQLLGWRIAADYKQSLSDFASAASFNAEYERHVNDLTAILSRGTQQPIQATPILWTGWSF